MSLFAEYLREKTDDHILETQDGFATYRFIKDQEAVYIIDIYVVPEKRQTEIASRMANSICSHAKELGYKKLLGSVIPSNKNSTMSLKVLLAYGMKLVASSQDFVAFEKEI